MKKLLSIGILSFSLLLLLSGCTAKPSHTSQSQKEILAELVKYTDSSSPGKNKNYYWENGKAQLTGFDKLKAGDYQFAKDNLGRAATARAVLTYKEFKDSRGSRQGNPLNPPFWPKNKMTAIDFSLTNQTYHGYLYNRSHSISDSLLGAASYTSEYNFTTGTRAQNVGADQHGGMRAAEETAEEYWKAHSNSKETISYQTTPLYKDSETIPRGSLVDIKSSDSKIDVELVIINSAEGISLDYNSGRLGASSSSKNQATSSSTAALEQSSRTVYVASNGESNVYWYDKSKLPEGTNLSNLVQMTEAKAIAAGKRHTSKE